MQIKMKEILMVGAMLAATPLHTIAVPSDELVTIPLILEPEKVVEGVEPIPPPVVYTPITEAFQVESEGVSTYYHNTTVHGVREGETDVVTSTAHVEGLGSDICVGNPLGDNSYQEYACVVLPESLSDTYNRGDVVNVSYNGNIIECVVIDFNQIEHGNSLNFVGEFTYEESDVAWLVEEQ